MTTLVSIPNCKATHVLGESEVELAQGTLNLIDTTSTGVEAPPATHPMPLSESVTSKPILTLTVGSAAFTLFSTTLFGTQAQDSRVYLFTPEIGPGGGHGGFIRLVLPEGVKEDATELGKSQEVFEKILVEHGLLNDGVEASVSSKIEEKMGKGTHSVESNTNILTTEFDSTPVPQETSSPKPAEWIADKAARAGQWISSKVLTGTQKDPDNSKPQIAPEENGFHDSIQTSVRDSERSSLSTIFDSSDPVKETSEFSYIQH